MLHNYLVIMMNNQMRPSEIKFYNNFALAQQAAREYFSTYGVRAYIFNTADLDNPKGLLWS